MSWDPSHVPFPQSPPTEVGMESLSKILTGSSGDEWVLGETIGKSAAAKVKAAQNTRTGEHVAIKCVKRSTPMKDDSLRREISIMKSLKHPHILQFVDCMEDEEQLYIVLELAPGGDLFDLIAARIQLAEDEAQHYFRQLVDALSYMHTQGFVHRDLKPENLLLSADNLIKVADFGLSTSFIDENKEASMLSTPCGTRKYAAPELMTETYYAGDLVDVWSAGVILFVLTKGEFPFIEPTAACERFVATCEGDWGITDCLSADLQDLLRKMLAAEPSERITLNQVCAHPWVCGGAAEELAAAAGTQEGAASILAGCSAEEPGSLDIHPVCQSLDEPMVLGSLPLGGTLGTTMEDRFSENAMGSSFSMEAVLEGYDDDGELVAQPEQTMAGSMRYSMGHTAQLAAILEGNDSTNSTNESVWSKLSDGWGEGMMVNDAPQNGQKNSDEALDWRCTMPDNTQSFHTRTSSYWDPRASDLNLTLPQTNEGNIYKSLVQVLENLGAVEVRERKHGIRALLPVSAATAPDKDGRSKLRSGSFANTPTSLAHSIFAESVPAAGLSPAMVDMNFKIVVGPVSEMLVVRRVQGDVIAYHEIFRQLRGMLSQETYGALSTDAVKSMSNADLGHHVKRLRASSIASNMATPREPKRQALFKEESMLMEGYYGLAMRMINGVPLKSRWYHLRKYSQTFSGNDAMLWMMDSGVADTEEEATEMGAAMLSSGYYHEIRHSKGFSCSPKVYFQWADPLPGAMVGPTPVRASSVRENSIMEHPAFRSMF